MEWLRLLCYLTDLIYHAYNKISVRVRFLFVFLQFSSSNEHHSTLIASYLRRIASCSRSYLWDQECFQSYLSSVMFASPVPCRLYTCRGLKELGGKAKTKEISNLSKINTPRLDSL